MGPLWGDFWGQFWHMNMIWATLVRPNKYKGELVNLMSNIEKYLPMLTICFSNMINETTKEIKEDTTKIKDTTSATNATVKRMEAQMEDLKRLFEGEVDSKQLQEIQPLSGDYFPAKC